MDLMYSKNRSGLRPSFLLLHLALFALLMPTTITATYSIVATDATTRQVGGAGATCLPKRDIYEALYLSAPNRTVLHTQGLLLARDDPIIITALDMMQEENGTSLDAILEEMQRLDSNNYTFSEELEIPEVEQRQYGIANFDSQTGYSGKSLAKVWTFYGYRGEIVNVGKDLLDDRYTYRAAGNVVKNGTVDSLQSGFEEQNDDFNFGLCDMAGKLMTAMYRVADDEFGDLRCLGNDGTTATGAYLHIDNPDGTEFIHINVIDSNPKEPVEELKEQFVKWRKKNPCDGSEATSGAAKRMSPIISTLVAMFGVAWLTLSQE